MKKICSVLLTLIAILLLSPSLCAQQWKFIIYGDTRSNDAAHRSVLQSMKNNTPDYKFIINVGDVVSSGSSASDWTIWRNAMNAIFGSTLQDGTPPKYMAAAGNHDYATSTGAANWQSNLSGQYQQFGLNTYFYFDYNDARFVIMNSEISATGAQKTMLLDVITNNTKKWLFAIWHQPIFDFGPKSYLGTLHTEWGVPLYQYGCDIIFMGHSHYYIKTKKLQLNGNINPLLDPIKGTVQCVTGNGGAPPYTIVPNKDNNAYMIDGNYTNSYGYTEITIDGNTATLKHILSNGTVFDTQTYSANPKPGSVNHTPIEKITTEFVLHNAYPNPFNPSTQIKFNLTKENSVNLKIFDVTGKEVKTLISNQSMGPGTFLYTWDATDNYGAKVASGMYLVRISTPNNSATKKLILQK